VQQRRQQDGPEGGEACLLPVQLALQYRDLVAEDQDLGVLVPIARLEKTQDRERVHHHQVGQPQQHSHASCRGDRVAVAVPAPYKATKPRTWAGGTHASTCTDEFSAYAGSNPL
jgi:hypothetical protein